MQNMGFFGQYRSIHGICCYLYGSKSLKKLADRHFLSKNRALP
jgi:hypothetical protein